MLLLVVAGWAFAEAILFVLVADVPISFVAVRHGWRAAAVAAVAAAVAAAAGGALVHAWAAADPGGATRMIVALPGIDPALVAETARGFAAGGYMAMLAGSVSGVPYKLYALAAGVQGEPLIPFLLLSPFVRLPRFLGVALLAAALGRLASRRLGLCARLVVLTAFWLLFYIVYFAVMPA